MCVCVRVGERKGGRERDRGRERHTHLGAAFRRFHNIAIFNVFQYLVHWLQKTTNSLTHSLTTHIFTWGTFHTLPLPPPPTCVCVCVHLLAFSSTNAIHTAFLHAKHHHYRQVKGDTFHSFPSSPCVHVCIAVLPVTLYTLYSKHMCRIIIGKSEGALVIKTASLSPHLSTFPYRHCMYGTVCRIIIGKSEGALVIKTASLSPHLSTFPYRHCMYETVCRIIIGKSEGALVIKTVSLSPCLSQHFPTGTACMEQCAESLSARVKGL